MTWGRVGYTGGMHDRHDLTNEEWAQLKPLLPDRTPRRGGQWVDHRKVIDGVLWRTRAGCPWRDLPASYGNWKTVYNRHRRWSADGTWVGVLDGLRAGCDTDDEGEWIVGVDATVIRARTSTRPVTVRRRPDRVLADKAYSSRRIRDTPRRRRIKTTIPEPSTPQAARVRRGRTGGRPPDFDAAVYKKLNTAERAINKLRATRAVATRYDKRDFIYKGTVDVASIRIWLRDPPNPIRGTRPPPASRKPDAGSRLRGV
jgi:transposase